MKTHHSHQFKENSHLKKKIPENDQYKSTKKTSTKSKKKLVGRFSDLLLIGYLVVIEREEGGSIILSAIQQ